MRSLRLKNTFLTGIILLLVMAGCGGGGGAGGPTTGSVYVTLASLPGLGSLIQQFVTASDGKVFSTTTVAGTGEVVFSGLAVDGAGNTYVGGTIFENAPILPNIEILVFAPGASGVATPIRTIMGTSTGLVNAPEALAVDGSGNIYAYANVFVDSVEYFGILVFSSTANGNAAPSRVIAGSATDINTAGLGQIAVDSDRNVYVPGGTFAQANSILIFDSGSDGNVLPTRTLTGPDTQINAPLAVTEDKAGNIYVADQGVNAPPSILEFRAGSTGNAAPIRTISGSATMIGEFRGITVDDDGNIYLNNVPDILIFAPSARGNVAPSGVIPNFAESNSIAAR